MLLADVGAMWVASPWPMLTSKLFDVVSAPDQRFGEGFGFPLGADFCYFQSTNSSINLLIQLADRMEATQRARAHIKILSAARSTTYCSTAWTRTAR